MATDNLQIPDIAASQNQKEVTANAAHNLLDLAMNDSVAKAITTDTSFTTAEARENFLIELTGTPGTPRNIDMPDTNSRFLAVVNNTDDVMTIRNSASAGTGQPVIAVGAAAIFHYDGTDFFDLSALGGGAVSAASALMKFPRIPFRGALAKHSTTQVLTAGADITVAFDSEDYDTDDFHDLSTNNSRMTIPANVSRVRVIAAIDTSTPGSGDLKVWITKNGSGAGALPGVVMRSTTGISGSGVIVVSPVLDVVAGDHFELEVNSNVTGSLDGTAGTFLFIQVVEYNTVDPALAFRGALATRITSAQVISSGVATEIEFNGEDYDTDLFHDTSTNNERLTIPIGSGIKRVRLTGGMNTTTPSSGTIQMWIARNGGPPLGLANDSHDSATAEEEGLNIDTGVIDVSEGDFFELAVQFQVAGSVVNNAATFFCLEVIEQVAPSLVTGDPFRGARVSKSGIEVIGASSALDWDVEDYDTDGMHDTSVNTERLNVPAGVTKVRLNSGLQTSTPSSSFIQVFIGKNGEAFPGQAMVSQDAFTGTEGMNISTPVLEVVEGDYFELVIAVGVAGVAEIGATFFSMEIVEFIPPVTGLLPINVYIDGVPTVSVDILRMVATDGFLLPDDLDGSFGHVSTAPSGAVVVDVQKNGLSIGSISIATTGLFTFSTSGSAVEVFSPGDLLQLIAPADWLTLADLTITLRALLVSGVVT